MKRTALFLSILLFTFCSCTYIGGKRVRGNGDSVTQERQVGNFTGVSVRGGIDVVVAPGPVSSFKIQADRNLLDYIDIKNNGGIVEVRTRHGFNLRPVAGMKVFATAPSFSSIEVAGSGNITSQSKVHGDNKLNLEIKGSGDIRLDVDAPNIDATIAGSGSISLNGTTQNFEADIKGSGDVRSFNLLSENTNVDIAGSGNAEVFASKQLNVEIKGAGDVRYKGTAAVNQKIMGSGSVKQVN
ncbi:DUF2807 domain-containing protein [Chitinophagaceae bacterium LB-8]|uniref:DUF2807 domain-containing protein n=1 Tax=Paraflavisolibacter caeni TaxID=2982496 RepID=A0A9X2XTZ0_9BACT|nr:DUF2807 domain-containing protein [Paraflavisolibacter caeni]MCU7548371.1 DUF2807 domain-containing protein [Paraflavisolibacter caeni]